MRFRWFQHRLISVVPPGRKRISQVVKTLMAGGLSDIFPMTASQTYFDKTLQLLNHVRETQTPAIERAAEICADSIAGGGLVFLFGAGHSRMMCEEMTPRQGCFPGFVALVELALSNHAAIVGANGLRAPRR